MNITNIKSTYGYVGFLPFATFSLIPWIIGGEVSKTLIYFQLGYGAIIITFLGGFAWGWRDDQKNQKLNLSIGIGFSLLGCLILLLTYLKLILISLFLSIISFYLFFIFERSSEDFNKKDIDVQYEDGVVTVKSIHKADEKDEKDGVQYRGISKRQFTKSFTIADDVQVNGAELKDGLLKISMERIIPEAKKARSIDVK